MARNIMRARTMVLLALSSLIACSPQSTATVVPTATQVTATIAAPQPSTPTPTLQPPTAVPATPTQAAFAFPAGSRIAGADVGGLSVAAATKRVTTALGRYDRILTLRAGDYTTTL